MKWRIGYMNTFGPFGYYTILSFDASTAARYRPHPYYALGFARINHFTKLCKRKQDLIIYR